MARQELVSAVVVRRHRTSTDAIAGARLHARLAVARVRLLEATTLRDRRAKELRELLALAHSAPTEAVSAARRADR